MSSNNPESTAGVGIRALVIYVFNEDTGILESATELVNTKGGKRAFPKNVANAKKVLDGNDKLLQVHVYTSLFCYCIVRFINLQARAYNLSGFF
jgi:hypothetical protein